MGAVAAYAQTRHPDAPVIILPIGGGAATYVTPGAPSNKVIGLGFEGPLDPAELDRVEREWAARGEAVRIELSILADPSIAPALAARGYTLHGFENLLARPLAEVSPIDPPSGLAVEIVRDAAAADAWSAVAVDGFLALDGTGSPPDDPLSRESLEAILADFAGVPGTDRYLARLDGRPVGAASLRCDAGLAQLAGGATLAGYRGRGIHRALLARRLADARAAGCDLAVVTTAPGTRSQQNVMRRGFSLLYTRAVLVKPAPATVPDRG